MSAQELPFILEDIVASRETIRATSKNSDALRKVQLRSIRIRPCFNARRQGFHTEHMWELLLGIPDLAEAIFQNNGPATPLLGDITVDGVFYQTDGERRIRALRHLIREGKTVYPNGDSVDEVLVLLNPRNTTDLERKRKVLTTEDNLKLRPMDKAWFYKSFETEGAGMTHDEIAKFLNVSRQSVDNYIQASELSQEVQDKIDCGEITMTKALADYREANPKRKTKLVEVDIESGEVLEQKKPEEKVMNGDEDEFLDQQDNSISSAGTKGGPKEGGSGEVVIGKDSIYMDGQKLALWKQFVNRYEKLKTEIIMGATLENGHLLKVDDMLAERLKNEYNLTVK